MASKKEIKEYVKIKLEEKKKETMPQPDYTKHFVNNIEDCFLRELVVVQVAQDYACNNPLGYRKLYINGFTDKMLPVHVFKALYEANSEREHVAKCNKEIKEYNAKIDKIYDTFCVEMLLVGNKDLADFASKFIEKAGNI
jgi:hypothetical protein